MPDELGVHILGPRYGESIVLELPDGGLGVIDSFADQTGPHPVIGWLRRSFPTADRLRFVAVTHPHADHCHRVAELFQGYQVAEAWAFHPFPAGQVQNYFRSLRRHRTRDRVEEDLGLRHGSVHRSLLQLDREIDAQANAGTLRFRQMRAPRTTFSLSGGRVAMDFLTPGDDGCRSYAHDSDQAGRAIFQDGPTLRVAGRLPEPDHNAASCAVLIRFGQAKALLMSDAESGLWVECLTDGIPAGLRGGPVQLLKVSHHGSLNGYHTDTYAAVADSSVTTAVVTPFRHGRLRLPSADGVRAIQPHVKNLFTTNREAAVEATGLNWESVTPAPQPSVPDTWLAAIRGNPDLDALLIGRPEPNPGSVPSVPLKWVYDATNRTELWRLLKPQFRPSTAHPDRAIESTVSARLTLTGGCRIIAGPSAGRLL